MTALPSPCATPSPSLRRRAAGEHAGGRAVRTNLQPHRRRARTPHPPRVRTEDRGRSRRAQRLPHQPHRRIQIRDHQRRIQPQHAPPEARKLAVPARVLGGDARVITAIHFHGEATRWRGQIHDEAADDILTTEGNSQLRALQAGPQPALRQRRRRAALRGDGGDVWTMS